MRTGPQLVSIGSSGARPEAWTLRWTPSRTTLNAASTTDRFGYRPIATAKNSEPSRS